MNRRLQGILLIGGGVALIIVLIILISLNQIPQTSDLGDPEKEHAANSETSVQRYPIMAYVPHYSDDLWSLDTVPPTQVYEEPPDGYIMPFFIYVDTVLNDSELRAPLGAQYERLEAMRKRAMKYLTDNGIKVEEYAFRYTHPYLQDKYGTTKPGPVSR